MRQAQRLTRQGDENHALFHMHPGLFEREIFGAKTGFAQARRLQQACRVVGPCVVGADKAALARVPLCLVAQPGTPVAADVEQGPHLPVLPTHQDEGFTRQLGGKEIPRCGKHAGVAHAVPVRRDKVVHVQGEQVRVGIKSARQCMAGAALRERGAQRS